MIRTAPLSRIIESREAREMIFANVWQRQRNNRADGNRERLRRVTDELVLVLAIALLLAPFWVSPLLGQ